MPASILEVLNKVDGVARKYLLPATLHRRFYLGMDIKCARPTNAKKKCTFLCSNMRTSNLMIHELKPILYKVKALVGSAVPL